jgi:phosphatidate cytidylyltransferase
MTADLVSGAPIVGGILGVASIGVWLSARRDFVLRLLSFAAASPILLVAANTGKAGAVGLAAGLTVVCCWEYSRMAGLRRISHVTLTAGVLAMIASSAAHMHVPLALIVLVGAAPAVVRGRGDHGFAACAALAWGLGWLGCSLSVLPLLPVGGVALLPVAIAVSIGDVAAYFGGSLARPHAPRRPWLALGLSPLSPNKTWAGAVVGSAAATGTLAIFGAISPIAVLAVTVGAVLGDLLESLVKRGCGVKDAGAWLPGFGGLLDRVDSLLGALLILAVLT